MVFLIFFCKLFNKIFKIFKMENEIVVEAIADFNPKIISSLKSPAKIQNEVV